jgi:hypothetical protein
LNIFKIISHLIRKVIIVGALIGMSIATQADVLCEPTSPLNVMVKSNGDIIYYDWYGKKHLAFKANSDMPAYLADVMMRGLIEAIVQRQGSKIKIQASYPDSYDCKVDNTTTAPLRILFNQTKGRY